MSWRYIAQRIAGPSKGQFLDWNLPLGDVEVTNSLGTNWFKGAIEPQIKFKTAADGRPLLDKWSTAIWAEEDGHIRGGGILVENQYAGPKREIEVMGYSGYPFGIPWSGEYAGIEVDPVEIALVCWNEVQRFENGDLDLIVIARNGSPVRLGVPGKAAYQEVYLGGAWRTRTSVNPSDILPTTEADLAAPMTAGASSMTVATIAKFAQLDLPFEVKISSERIIVNARAGKVFSSLTRAVGTSTATGHNKGTSVKYVGTPIRTVDKVDPQPYRLSWWEAPDIGTTLDSLRKEGPFEQRETHYWSPTLKDTIIHKLEYEYPRIGKRQLGLRFVLGENVINMPGVSDDGTYFANEILGLGSGTGRTMIRATAAVRDNRLRRVHVLTSTSTKSIPLMQTKVGQDLKKHTATLSLSSITVIDHDNARITAIQPGDEILVQADIGHFILSQWCKIITVTIKPEIGNEAVIALEGLTE